jgi:hypothetical protein
MPDRAWAPFRRALTERGLAWAVGIPFKQKVYPADVAMIFPLPSAAVRASAIPVVAAQACWTAMADDRFVRHRGRLSARYHHACASLTVTPKRIRDAQHRAARKLGHQQHRSTGEQILSLNLPPPPQTLAAAIKARWVCEQTHQQLKEELGLDPSGRSGRAPTDAPDDDDRRLPAIPPPQAATKRKKRIPGPPPAPSLPAIRQAIPRTRCRRRVAPHVSPSTIHRSRARVWTHSVTQ